MFGDLDDRETRISLRSSAFEQQVDLFQTPRSSLREEEIDHWDHDEARCSVHDVNLVLYFPEHDGTCDDNAEICEPVDGGCLWAILEQRRWCKILESTYQRIGWSSNGKRNQLNTPQIADTLPTNREESNVDEEERGHDIVRSVSVDVGSDAECYHATAHSSSTEHC
jgi:hypothetical protein